MKINTGMGLPGGPHFPVTPTVTLADTTFERLYGLIVEYRMRHGLPAGDPVADVAKYACEKWPMFCHPEPIDFGFAQPTEQEEAWVKVVSWTAGLNSAIPRGGWGMSSNEDYSDRAGICMNCPKKAPWKSGCGSCGDNRVLGMLVRARNGRGAAGGVDESQVQACSVMGWDCMTAAAMGPGVPLATPEQRAAVPENCWVKNLP